VKPVLPGLPGGAHLRATRLPPGPIARDFRQKPDGALYLYLDRSEYVETWLNGGEVPFFPARKYLSDERKGTLTPDEILQENWEGVERQDLDRMGIHVPTGSVRNLQFIDCSYNGSSFPDTHISSYFEDVALFCCSRSLSMELMERFEKKAVVEIVSLNFLINQIEDSVGEPCRFGYVSYTNTKRRSHFLKSSDDSWQDEYRIVIPWVEQTPVNIGIPAGIAKLIDLRG